ncbi:MAG: carboxylesterase family protein, partial [Caulobacteraceae bacterium]
LYPASNPGESVLANTRDALYGWTSERLVRSQTARGQASFLYLFDHAYPAANEAGLHAFHASELPFMFGNTGRTPPRWPRIPDTAQEAALSAAMVDYWTSFARTGRPVAEGEPDWVAYDEAGAHMVFGDAPRVAPSLMPGMFALHESAVCRRKAAGAAWNWNTGLMSPQLVAAEECD